MLNTNLTAIKPHTLKKTTMVNFFDKLFKRQLKEYLIKVDVIVNTGFNSAIYKSCALNNVVIPIKAYIKKEAETIALNLVKSNISIKPYTLKKNPAVK